MKSVRLRLLTLVAAVVASLTAVSAASPSFPGTNGRIVFQSNRAGGAGEIYSMRSDATDVKRLTWNDVVDRFPRYSPDGQQIVFSRRVTATNFDIWIMNADGSGERQLTSGSAIDAEPVFTDGGERVVFQRATVGLFACPCELRIVGVSGSGEQLLDTGPGNALMPDVSANGKLAFVSDRDGPAGIYVGNLKGGPVKRVTEVPAGFADIRPRWSPRGNDLVFMRDDGVNQNDVYTVHHDGTSLRQLTSGPRFEEHPQWSPDGERIVFAVFPPAGGARLHTIDADDGSDEQVLPQLAAPLQDDFGDGRIDSSKWFQFVDGTGASIGEAGGRLLVDVAAGAVPGGAFNSIEAHVSLQCELVGDFDMEVGYALVDWPAANGFQARLNGFTALTSAQVFRQSKPWGEQYGSWIDPSFVATDTGDTAGALRMTRSGGGVTASYLSGGAWVPFNTAPRPEPMKAAVGAADYQTFSGLRVGVAFDDFRIRAGTLTCPSWWRDSGPDWAAG